MATSKQKATMAKEDAPLLIHLVMKFYTEHLEAGNPVSFCACVLGT